LKFPRSTNGGGIPRHFFINMQKILSAFIDESGDFGGFEKHSPYYIVTFVFHNQADSIQDDISHLEQRLSFYGYYNHVLHTGPLIRNEEVYRTLTIDNRKAIFNSFMTFAIKCNFRYKSFIVEKKANDNQFKLISSLSRLIREFLENNKFLMLGYDKIIIYYDNGQTQLTKILASIFTDSNVEFRRISPAKYRLFQIADLITTLELINRKRQVSENSNSEIMFFGTMREFNKNYYKYISKKKIES
jgi:hypothetical protein